MEDKTQANQQKKQSPNEKTGSNCKSTGKEKGSKPLITIVDFNSNPIKKNVINSPKSLFCMKQFGLSQDDFIFISFKDFCQSHPETITMTKEEKESRYNFTEDMRRTKIEKVIEEREYLANQEEDEKRIMQQNLRKEKMAMSGGTQKPNDTRKTGSSTYYSSTQNFLSSKNDKMEMQEEINQKQIGQIVKNKIDQHAFAVSTTKRFSQVHRLPLNVNDTNQVSIEKGQDNWSSECEPDENEVKRQKAQAKQEIKDRNQASNLAKQEQRKKNIEKAIIYKDYKSNEVKAAQYEAHCKKIEQNRMKEIMKEDHIKQKRRMEELDREKKKKDIDKKIATFGKNRETVLSNRENKAKTMMDIQAKHNENLKKVHCILGKGVNDESMKQIQQTFYDNEYVVKATNDYFKEKNTRTRERKPTKKEMTTTDANTQETKKENEAKPIQESKQRPYEEDNAKPIKESNERLSEEDNAKPIEDSPEHNDKDKPEEDNKSQSSLFLNGSTPVKSAFTEEEITEKVREYRIEANKEFLSLLSREKANEELREERLSKAETEQKRKELEKQYGKERTMANYRLSLKNEELTDKVSQFERSLRKQKAPNK